jgi:hypothetical protein
MQNSFLSLYKVAAKFSIQLLTGLFALIIIPFSNSFAQDFYSADKYQDLKTSYNSFQAWYYVNGHPEQGYNLALTYKMAIKNLKMKGREMQQLDLLARGILPDLFKVKPNKSDRAAYKLARKANISFDFLRNGKLYARCDAPKNSNGYSIGAIDLNKNPYPIITSSILYVSLELDETQSYIVCKDHVSKASIIPKVILGDLVILRQNKRAVLRGNFK